MELSSDAANESEKNHPPNKIRVFKSIGQKCRVREDSLPWLFFCLAVPKMFVCLAVPFRLNHVIEAGDSNEQVWLKFSDYLSSHLMLGCNGA